MFADSHLFSLVYCPLWTTVTGIYSGTSPCLLPRFSCPPCPLSGVFWACIWVELLFMIYNGQFCQSWKLICFLIMHSIYEVAVNGLEILNEKGENSKYLHYIYILNIFLRMLNSLKIRLIMVCLSFEYLKIRNNQ